jgi:hypothetical protein
VNAPLSSPAKRWPALELLGALVLFEGDVWLLREASSLGHLGAIALGGLLLAASFERQGQELRPALRLAPPRAWLEALALTGVLGMATWLLGEVVGGARLRSLATPRPASIALALTAVGVAVGQQVVLNLFLRPVSAELVGGGAPAGALAVTVFALAHLPNPWLVLMSGVSGCGWVVLFLRHGRLLPLVLSHALLAGWVLAILPAHVHGDLLIGRAALEAGTWGWP